MNKRQWRREAKTIRAEMLIDSAAHCDGLDSFLADHVPQDRWVVIYDAMADEVDLSSLVDRHPAPTRRFAVTRTPEEGFALTVHPYSCSSEIHPYGYRQPVVDAPRVPDREIGAVLVPALAFDRTGVRLGRGKGYYDRFLGRLDDDVLRIGITGGYIVEALPSESFDISMTHLATAEGVLSVPLNWSKGFSGA